MVDEREVLRRRLYARGATEEDRRRYAAVAPDRPRSRRPPRAPASVLLAAAVLVAASGAALTGRLAGPEPRAIPRSTVAAAVPLTRSLISGTAERIPVEVDGVQAVAQRLRGVGEALVSIDTAAAASSEGGSVLVALASSEPVQMSWEAVRPDRTVSREVVARSAPADRRGARDPVIARYTGDPPLWIRVHAPAGALWTLTVALARTSDPRLR